MHSKINPPARRSRTFDEAATMSMESLLRTNQRMHTRGDTRRRDLEIALRVECCAPSRNVPTSDLDRDWDDGWLYGIALATRMMHDQLAMTQALAATGAAGPRGQVYGW